MADLNKLLAGLAQSGLTSGFAGGLAGGAVSGALFGKRGRKTVGTLLKIGGVAALGGLAWNAYQDFQRRQQAGAGGRDRRWQSLPREQFELSSPDGGAGGAQGLLLIRAMITAAFSDGHLDVNEQRRIFDHVDTLALPEADRLRLFDELRDPRTIEAIAAEARDPAAAVEVYAASLMAIDEAAPRAEAYLRRLQALLELPDSLVAAIHEQAADAADRAAAA